MDGLGSAGVVLEDLAVLLFSASVVLNGLPLSLASFFCCVILDIGSAFVDVAGSAFSAKSLEVGAKRVDAGLEAVDAVG